MEKGDNIVASLTIPRCAMAERSGWPLGQPPYSTLPNTSAIFFWTYSFAAKMMARAVPRHFQVPGAFHVALNTWPSTRARATGLRNDVTADATSLNRSGASSSLAFLMNAVH